MSWLTWPAAAALGSALLNTVIGCLAYARSRGRSLYRSLAVISFSFAAWSLVYVKVYPAFADPFWMQALFTPLAVLPGAGLSFVWAFTGLPQGARQRRTVPLYAAGLLLIVLMWTGRISLLQFRAAFIFGGIPIFGLCLALLFLHWRQSEDAAEKNRRGYLLAAFVIAVVGGFTDFLPQLGVPFLSLANLSLMTYSLIVLTAIEKHYLLDLRSAAGRAFALIASSSILALILAGLAWLTQRLEGQLFLNFFALSLALVIILPLVWERVNRAFNQLVFQRQAGHERALERFERGLEGAARLADVERAAADAVRAIWGAETEIWWDRAALRGIEPSRTLPDELRVPLAGNPQAYTLSGLRRQGSAEYRVLREWLERGGKRALAPVTREGELVAALLAGPASQGYYDLADLRVLRRLGVALGRAVKGVELTQEVLHADRLAQMGMLAAGIAHDVRNPLSAILGAVELLSRGIPEQSRRDCLRILKEEVEGLNGIVTELVDYSAPRGKNAKVEWRAAWERAMRLLKTDLPSGLELKFAGESVVLGVSGGHLQQILLNLIKNAARAAQQGGAAPQVLVRLTAAQGKAVLEVLDNGAGIPEEALPRLFIPFATRSPGGTGLGLAMVRRLAELYDGRAWAENRAPGPGARFVVELPLA
ncbi:MAG: ATP-binding protein [Elusimicrobiota bacterium]